MLPRPTPVVAGSISTEELAECVGVSKSTIQRTARRDGCYAGVKPIAVTHTRFRWPIRDLVEAGIVLP